MALRSATARPPAEGVALGALPPRPEGLVSISLSRRLRPSRRLSASRRALARLAGRRPAASESRSGRILRTARRHRATFGLLALIPLHILDYNYIDMFDYNYIKIHNRSYLYMFVESCIYLTTLRRHLHYVLALRPGRTTQDHTARHTPQHRPAAAFRRDMRIPGGLPESTKVYG